MALVWIAAGPLMITLSEGDGGGGQEAMVTAWSSCLNWLSVLQTFTVSVKFSQRFTSVVQLPAVEKVELYVPVVVATSVAVEAEAYFCHHSARYGTVPPVTKLVHV